jgi:hypothetical protein
LVARLINRERLRLALVLVFEILLVLAFLALLHWYVHAQRVIWVATDKQAYSPGEKVRITVTISEQFGNAMIWVYVDQPNMLNFNYTCLDFSPAKTTVTWTIQLPNDAQPGNWTVTVTWNHNKTETWFYVAQYYGPIPEFRLAPVLLIATFVIVWLLIRRYHCKTCPDPTAATTGFCESCLEDAGNE